jgi:hypothetical protein
MWKYVEAKMPNITLAIDEDLLDRARTYAERKGTTLNALVRELLGDEIDQDKRREESRKRLLELMDNSTARLPKGYKFNREEIYETPSVPGHKHPDLRRRRKANQSG